MLARFPFRQQGKGAPLHLDRGVDLTRLEERKGQRLEDNRIGVVGENPP